jgi:hypothetical protein
LSLIGDRFGAEHISIEPSGWIRIGALLPKSEFL